MKAERILLCSVSVPIIKICQLNRLGKTTEVQGSFSDFRDTQRFTASIDLKTAKTTGWIRELYDRTWKVHPELTVRVRLTIGLRTIDRWEGDPKQGLLRMKKTLGVSALNRCPFAYSSISVLLRMALRNEPLITSIICPGD
jgi:hypothetical protein